MAARLAQSPSAKLDFRGVIVSEANQGIRAEGWIASSLQRKIALQFCRQLLAMTANRKSAVRLRG
jgi:hypothetical protein